MIETTQRSESTGQQNPPTLHYTLDSRSRWDRTRRLRRIAAIWILLVASAAVTVLLLQPNLIICREPAWRIRCAANLKQIGLGLQIYAYEHAGQFPPSFDEIVRDVEPRYFVCPKSADTQASGPTTRATLQAFHQTGHNSYIYVAAGLSTRRATPNHVLAYEQPSNHGGDGMNVLYGDGHIDWVSRAEAARVIAELQAGFNPPRPPTAHPSGR